MSDLQPIETQAPTRTRLTGQKLPLKPPLKPREVWSIRIRLQLGKKKRDLALFNWLSERRLQDGDYLFPSRVYHCSHLSTRQYARIVDHWVASIGLDPHKYGTHSMRRTKAALIYKKTGNLRAVQLLLGHTKLESTVRYLGVEVDDALRIAEQVEL